MPRAAAGSPRRSRKAATRTANPNTVVDGDRVFHRRSYPIKSVHTVYYMPEEDKVRPLPVRHRIVLLTSLLFFAGRLCR
jgi:hypothetical protein